MPVLSALRFPRTQAGRPRQAGGRLGESGFSVTFFNACQARARLLGAVVAAATLMAAALVQAAPAQAALSGTDWTEQTLPANFIISSILSPVSCVHGTRFCVVVAFDSAVIVDGEFNGQAALVSTNGGRTWTGRGILPSTISATAVSCVSRRVCFASGPGIVTDAPAVAKTINGGLTWTDVTPASWATATWWPNSIDCVSAKTCWLAGIDGKGVSQQDPAVAKTTDGGATWTTFTNLPTFTSSDRHGTYQLSAISCISALSCVAGGGLNEFDGTATVISTTDGGVNWSRSADPALAGLQQVMSLSCLRGASGIPTCAAAGAAPKAAGPIVISSQDGGATWAGAQTFDNTGWFSSISCVNVTHCWATGAGTSVALAGTSDGGASWSSVTADTTNEDGRVSCLSVRVCVATTDNGLWVTSDDGGLVGTG
jgi:hypothetical protein